MSPNLYEICRKECLNNRCYDCYCNNKEYCFAFDLENLINDFPNRKFCDLSVKEQKKFLCFLNHI